MLIRDDHVVNMCEMKFYNDEFSVSKETSVNSLCKRVEKNNIPVNPPHLKQYDNLLRREVI